MTNYEGESSDLMREIEEYLRQNRSLGDFLDNHEEHSEESDQEDELVSISMVREDLREAASRALVQSKKFKELIDKYRGEPMIVPTDQATAKSVYLATLAEAVVKFTQDSDMSGGNHESTFVYRYPTADGTFSINLKGESLPSFIPTHYIGFENHLSAYVKDLKPRLAEALGITELTLPVGKLTVGSRIGALTDPQTKTVMERALDEFPDAPQNTHFSYTEYYFFGDRIGKVVRLDPALLGQRLIHNDGLEPIYALSNITAGDLVIAKTGLLVAGRAIIYPSAEQV